MILGKIKPFEEMFELGMKEENSRLQFYVFWWNKLKYFLKEMDTF